MLLSRSARAFSGALASALILSACGSSSGSQGAGEASTPNSQGSPTASDTGVSAEGPITLGSILILSGAVAAYGQQNETGIEIAIDHLNEDGGLLGGREVGVEIRDNAADPDQTTTVLRELASNPEIPIIVGPTGTGGTVAAAPLAEQLGIAIISPGSAGTWQGDFNDWTFRVNLTTNNVLPDVLDEVMGEYEVDTAAVIYDQAVTNNASEQEAAQDALAAADVDVKTVEAIRTGDRNFGPQIAAMLEGEHPELMYVAAGTDEAALIMSQARERGYKGPFMGGAGMNDPSIFDLSGGASAGAITFFPFDPKADREIVSRFVDDYRERHGETPPAFAALAYDATMLAANAIESAGTLDREEVRDALGNITDLELVASSYTYETSGDNTTPTVHVFRMDESGEFVPLS